MLIKILFSTFLTVGSVWVLWLLLALSVLSLGIIFNRWRQLSRQESVGAQLWHNHVETWLQSDNAFNWKAAAEKLAASYPCVESRMMRTLARCNSSNTENSGLIVEGTLLQERVQLEKYLAVLGTLGSNAPFIGLFGTVLGIIRAFHDLGGELASAGVQAVSQGLSEALVATAIGLLVAIPSVMFFNYFQRKIKTTMSRAESLSMLLLGSKS